LAPVIRIGAHFYFHFRQLVFS